MSEKKSRGWMCIVYPESAPDRWQESLCERGVPCLISPLHCLDVNADGEIKKAHYHVLLVWDGPTTLSNAKSVVQSIGGVGCIPCVSIRGAARYLCHLDNPDKYQYDKRDVVCCGGLDFDELCSSVNDSLAVLYQILAYCRQTGTTSFADLADYCIAEKPEWAKEIFTKHRENVWRYLRSLEYDLSRRN